MRRKTNQPKPTAPDIETEIAAIAAEVPPEEWAKVPADLTDNLDHYIYGTPKKAPPDSSSAAPSRMRSVSPLTRERMAKRLGPLLLGQRVHSFRVVVGGTLILYLEPATVARTEGLTPTRLWIESAWRLCKKKKVIAGSLDSPESLVRRLQDLVGALVKSVRLVGLVPDIFLTFGSGFAIESFSRSTRDEQWELRQADGLRLGLGEDLEMYETRQKPD